MADQTFQIGVAVGVQSGFGTPLAAIADLVSGGGSGGGGAINSADGYVLGDAESGDAESGITIPDLEGDFRDVPVVSGSFTEQADSYLKTLVNGFAISVQLKGNGATATPAAGEAQPYAGIDALWQMAGLSGANGTAPDYDYTPGTSTVYGTIKLWLSGMAFVFADCLVDSVDIDFPPGEAAIATFNISVGAHDPNANVPGSASIPYFTEATFPTFEADNQSTLSVPVVEGVQNTWGTLRGFQDLTLTISNSIESFGDSNVEGTGQRQAQTERLIEVSGTIYMDDADRDFEYNIQFGGVAPTADWTFTIGDPAGATDVINAIEINANNVQSRNVKYNRVGTVTVVEITGKATSTSAGGEFTLRYE